MGIHSLLYLLNREKNIFKENRFAYRGGPEAQKQDVEDKDNTKFIDKIIENRLLGTFDVTIDETDFFNALPVKLGEIMGFEGKHSSMMAVLSNEIIRGIRQDTNMGLEVNTQNENEKTKFKITIEKTENGDLKIKYLGSRIQTWDVKGETKTTEQKFDEEVTLKKDKLKSYINADLINRRILSKNQRIEAIKVDAQKTRAPLQNETATGIKEPQSGETQEAFLSRIGITLEAKGGKTRIAFKVGELDRSFLATKKFVDSLKGLNEKDVKTICYKRLIAIIKADRSIKDNRNNIGTKAQFDASNQEMQRYINTGPIETARAVANNDPDRVAAADAAPDQPAENMPVKEPSIEEKIPQLQELTKSLNEAKDALEAERTLIQMGEILKKNVKEPFNFTYGGQTFKWTPENGFKTDSKDKKTGFIEDMSTTAETAETGGSIQEKLIKAKEQIFGEKSSKYKNFIEETDKREIEKRRVMSDAKLEEYLISNLKDEIKDEYTNKSMKNNRDWIIENWTDFSGGLGGKMGMQRVEYTLQHFPFSFTREEVPAQAAEIMKNGLVSFNEIFEMIFPGKVKYLKSLDGKEIDSSRKFRKEFERLNAKTDRTDDEEKLYRELRTYIAPILKLKDSLMSLEYDEKNKPEQEEEVELSASHKKVREFLKQLIEHKEVNMSKASKDWKTFIAWLNGEYVKEMTMADIDGKTYSLDVGTFQRNFSPESALLTLENKISSAGENKTLVFDETKVLEELNRIIAIGVLQNFMQKESSKERELTDKEIQDLVKSDAFKEEMNKYKLTDLNSTPKTEQIEAFQKGLVIDSEITFRKQLEEGKSEIEKLSEKGDPAIIKQIVEQLAMNSQLSYGDIRAVRDKLVAAGGLTFDQKGVSGGGIGIKIPVNERLTVFVGLGGSRGGLEAGVGLNIKVYENEIVKGSVNFAIGTSGIGASFENTVKTKEVDISFMLGVGWSWKSIIPTVGGGVTFSINQENLLKKDLAKNQGENFEERMELIAKTYKEQFGLEDSDIDFLKAQVREAISTQTLRDAKYIFISSVGLSVVGPFVIPTIGISLGSATVFVPHRKEIANMLPRISDLRTRGEVERAIEELTKEKPKLRIQEKTGHIAYSKDGEVLISGAENKIDFSEFSVSTAIKEYNEKLAKAKTDLQLRKHSAQRFELEIQKPREKDIEIHIDPTLGSQIAGVETGVVFDPTTGKIFLVGDISDLIITRERFTVPFNPAKNRSPIRDVITIRRSDSTGVKDRSWIEEHESKVLVKLKKDKHFKIKAGPNPNAPDNIFIIAGFANMTEEEIQQGLKDGKYDIQALKQFLEKQKEFIGTQSDEELAEKQAIYNDIQKILNIINKSEFDKKIPREFIQKAGSIMDFEEVDGKKKYVHQDFVNKLAKTMGDGALIRDLLKKSPEFLTQIGISEIFEPNNENKLNTVVQMLMHSWYSSFYNKETNKELLKKLEKNIKFIQDDVLLPEFTATLKRIYPKLEAKEINTKANKLVIKYIKDIYGELLNNLDPKINPDFNFQEEMNAVPIPVGATFYSGSRRITTDGTKEGVWTHIPYFGQQFKQHDTDNEKFKILGFLESTQQKYPTIGDSEEAELGRVLFFMANPAPSENNAEFLQSSTAKLIFPLAFTGFFMKNNEYGMIRDLIRDIYETKDLGAFNTKLQNPEYQTAVATFRKITNIILKMQHGEIDTKAVQELVGNQWEVTVVDGKLNLVNEATDTRFEVEKLKLEVVAGAYAKCANASFYTTAESEIRGYRGNNAIGSFKETNEVVGSKTQNVSASINLFAGFDTRKTEAPTMTVKKEGEGKKPGQTSNGSSDGTSTTFKGENEHL